MNGVVMSIRGGGLLLCNVQSSYPCLDLVGSSHSRSMQAVSFVNRADKRRVPKLREEYRSYAHAPALHETSRCLPQPAFAFKCAQTSPPPTLNSKKHTHPAPTTAAAVPSTRCAVTAAATTGRATTPGPSAIAALTARWQRPQLLLSMCKVAAVSKPAFAISPPVEGGGKAENAA